MKNKFFFLFCFSDLSETIDFLGFLLCACGDKEMFGEQKTIAGLRAQFCVSRDGACAIMV